MANTRTSSEPRRKPRQKRSTETINRILDASAELLEEIGFDKLNTNLICERAGLTPPALYRYFPNKYAVLKELGERLMRVQNQALYDRLDDMGPRPTVADIIDRLRGQYQATITQKGASWIMRALHATPQLVEVRRSSHREMVARIVAAQTGDGPAFHRDAMERRMQIVVETGYAMLEMLIDNPAVDPEATFNDVAIMMATLLPQD